MSRILLRRAGITLATGALALTGALASAPTASAAPADRSAGWLASQLKNGVMYNAQFDYDDYGLTADSGYALIEIGGEGRKVQQMRRALAADVDSWTTGVDFGRPNNVYAGSVAKAVVFAEEAARAQPRDFGGVDLVERLEQRVSDAGRLRDAGRTSYANTIGQAFAVRGLSVAGSEEAATASAFLLQQQCSEGFFRLDFSANRAPDQGCDAADDQADLDATALAVLNLQAVPAPDAAVEGAIRSALDWMLTQQRRNGGFGGGPATEASNANSTGLAAWALGQGRRCRAAASAAGWVKDLQLDNGAVAYDRRARRVAENRGITEGSRDQFRRATSQAAPGLEYLRVRACRA